MARAGAIADEDVALNRAIAAHGLPLIAAAWERFGRQRPVAILTHCNAGWLATVDWGTALAPIYRAHDAGIAVHVWVDETRPRNQGASLTAWELGEHGVPHTVIVDNAGGHLMQKGRVDLCLVGTDRTTAAGDVANKIGTYLKALAAHDNGVPFYVAAALAEHRLDHRRRAQRHPDRGARRGRSGGDRRRARRRRQRARAPHAGGERRAQHRLRRDAGAPCHRARHRARRLPGLARRTMLRFFPSARAPPPHPNPLPDGEREGPSAKRWEGEGFP